MSERVRDVAGHVSWMQFLEGKREREREHWGMDPTIFWFDLNLGFKQQRMCAHEVLRLSDAAHTRPGPKEFREHADHASTVSRARQSERENTRGVLRGRGPLRFFRAYLSTKCQYWRGIIYEHCGWVKWHICFNLSFEFCFISIDMKKYSFLIAQADTCSSSITRLWK